MSLANLEPELLTNPTAVLATNGHDGHPQLTAVWYIVEDDRICISITESTRKARNLAAERPVQRPAVPSRNPQLLRRDPRHRIAGAPMRSVMQPMHLG